HTEQTWLLCDLCALCVELRRNLPRFPPRLELLERAAEPNRRLEAVLHDFGRLVAVARHADDHRLVAPDRSATDQLDRGGERRPSGRLGEDAFGFDAALDRVADV